MRKVLLLPITLLLAFLFGGCATTSPGPGALGPGAPIGWPYHGFTRHDGTQLSLYRDRFFSPGDLAINPSGTRLIAPTGVPGAMTVVRLPEGSIEAVLDFGEGISFESLDFRPDGEILHVVASTVDAANLGRVPLARALLEVEFGSELGAVPIPLRPGAYTRGVALRADRSWYYSLETAGPDLPGGATLSRVDLYNQEVYLRSRLGSVPIHVRNNGLLYDERERWLLALLSNDEPESDFDPPADPARMRGTFVARVDPDTLGIWDQVTLSGQLEFIGIAPSPRGVVAVGMAANDLGRGTAIIEIDPRLGREIGWLDLPEQVSDMCWTGDRLLLVSRRGLYVVSLDFLSITGFIGIPFERPLRVAVTPGGSTACVTFDDPERAGLVALAIVDLEANRLVRVIR